MIRVIFFRRPGVFSGFHCSGHSGFAPSGEDIVCAGVTSAVRLTECIVNDVAHAGAKVAVEENGAAVSLTLPDGPAGEDRVSQAAMEALWMYFRQLQREYPDYMTVSEV